MYWFSLIMSTCEDKIVFKLLYLKHNLESHFLLLIQYCTMSHFENSLAFAQEMDAKDPLKSFIFQIFTKNKYVILLEIL